MPLVINTNFAATLAANNLAASNTSLQRSLNRLSSGSKIVNPADDAGGLAVSMKLSAAARRSGATNTNLQNMVSFLQTQDGALKVAGKVMDRISELRILAQDQTKNSTDIANYNQEFTQLQAELTSIAGEKFNGVSLFGSSGLAVGATENGGSTVTMQGVDLLGGATVPAWSNFSGSAPGANWTASDPGISNSTGYTRFHADGTLTSSQSNISGPYTMSFTINAVSSGTGVMSLSAGGSSSLDFKTITGAVDGTDHAFVINVDASGNATWSMDSGAQTGSLATFSPGGGGAITFTQTNSAQNDLHIKDGFTLTSSGGGGGTGNIADVVAASSLSSLSLSSITGAIQDLATNRAQNGASQSRLGFATELLTVNKANLEAANSRIADVDVADESTQLARFNILVQAGTAMLSQANQSSQSVMKLLG